MTIYHIGCSGYYYKHWKESFYPAQLPQRKWFDYYCRYFNTLELNVTFYRFPRLTVLQNWYDSCPEHFRFAVKAPRVITHFKKFNDTERMLNDFYTTVKEGLKEKCGCCLFQLPPNYTYSEDKLEKIINALDTEVRNVVEFRHESWWSEAVFRELGNQQISFCGMSHPSLPKDIIHNTDLFYYRFHGEEHLYASLYAIDNLTDFGKELKGQKGIKDAFVFFNNDINTYAVTNATQLNDIMRS